MLFIKRVSLSKVNDISPTLGCDPEFFLKYEGAIVGAEKFIPKHGIAHIDVNGGGVSKFIIDGVQAELNPRPNYCRANIANEIKACFKTLAAELATRGKGFTCDFSRTVEISKENLMELDEQSRKFGCAPSKSIYDDKCGIKCQDVDPTEYRVRAAGGHIHIGKSNPTSGLTRALTTDHEKTVEMLDLICGNTSVLIDRDAGNKERRKVYGKAGEYRLPGHGLEYRTLSNFWLTSYPLMSFAFGMVRLAVQLIADEQNNKDFYNEFTSKVKRNNVHAAINENDFDLAMDNFSKIEKLIEEVTTVFGRYPIHGNNMEQFHHFIAVVQQKGLTYWFPDEPLKHWTTISECHAGGFHDYLLGHVYMDMTRAQETKAA